MPTVSLIIPVFNAASYLDECLRSVRGQSYGRVQIILVDDGSTDRSGAIAERHAAEDSRITFLRQPNQGVSAARNAGIARATGAFLCFFDADDVMYPHSVEVRVAAMDTPTPVDVVHANHLIVDAYRSPIRESHGVPLGVRPLEQLLTSPCMGCTDVMLRRSTLEAAGLLPGRLFDQSLACYEDWDVWLRCGKAGLSFRHVDSIVDEYRQHGQNSSRHLDRNLEHGLRMIDAHRPSEPALTSHWKAGRYSIQRGWLWSLWDEPRSCIWKMCRIARWSLRYPGLLWTFIRVANVSLLKRACGSRSSATNSETDIVADLP